MTTPRSYRATRVWAALMLSAFMAGCANMASHDELATEVQTASRAGGIPAAIARLDASATSDSVKKALLYNLERGELLRLENHYDESTQSFMVADERVKEWEDTARSTPKNSWATWARR